MGESIIVTKKAPLGCPSCQRERKSSVISGAQLSWERRWDVRCSRGWLKQQPKNGSLKAFLTHWHGISKSLKLEEVPAAPLQFSPMEWRVAEGQVVPHGPGVLSLLRSPPKKVPAVLQTVAKARSRKTLGTASGWGNVSSVFLPSPHH